MLSKALSERIEQVSAHQTFVCAILASVPRDPLVRSGSLCPAQVWYMDPRIEQLVEVVTGLEVRENIRLKVKRTQASAAALGRAARGEAAPHGATNVAICGAASGWNYVPEVAPGTVVVLNVGGQLFSTRLETLTKEEGSYLEGMFTGRIPVSLDEVASHSARFLPCRESVAVVCRGTTVSRFAQSNRSCFYVQAGRVFLDRDPAAFRQVLTFLRDDAVPIPRDSCAREALLAEARYLQVYSRVAALRATNPFGASPAP